MDKNQKKKAFFASRRFKYGSMATALTVFFIVVVVLLNAIVSAVDSKYKLYFDLTDDQLFSVSEATATSVASQIAAYRDANGADPQIKITFFAPRDILVADETYNWIVTMAESYAERFSQIQVEYKEDLKSHPQNYSYYTELGHTINSTTIIISNSLEKAAFRILSLDSCLVYDENGSYVWAFQGEMKFNAAILYILSQKRPVVTFTEGHGETIPAQLTEILNDTGFDVEYVDLGTEDINPDSKVLFMCSPKTDILSNPDDAVVSEYTKISNYLNDYRSMVVIAGPSTPVLPVLDELLADWGLKLIRNQIVMDNISSITSDNRYLYVEYPISDSVSKAITGSLTELSSPPRSVSYLSAPIEILFEGDGDSMGVEPVLTSSVNSYVEEITVDGTQRKNGPFNLMAVSSRFTIEDNTDVYSHVLLIGSDSFTELNSHRSQFGNTEIVYNIIRLLSNEYVPTGTDYKVLEDYTIDIDSGEVYTYGIVTALVIPLMIFAAGIVVFIKRKHM